MKVKGLSDLTKAYLESYEYVLNQLDTSENGLDEEESKERLKEYGLNKLQEGKKVSLFQRFIKELINPMVIVLIVAAIVSGVTAFYAKESFADVFIIC